MKTVIDCGDDKNFVFLVPSPFPWRWRENENAEAKNYTQKRTKEIILSLNRLIRVKSLNKEGLIIIFIIISQPINICLPFL